MTRQQVTFQTPYESQLKIGEPKADKQFCCDKLVLQEITSHSDILTGYIR